MHEPPLAYTVIGFNTLARTGSQIVKFTGRPPESPVHSLIIVRVFRQNHCRWPVGRAASLCPFPVLLEKPFSCGGVSATSVYVRPKVKQSLVLYNALLAYR